ncbi:hypothetical protein D3800_12900 [Microcystis aeruginosa NIES-298]|nr:hypothetical protein D3800_12900 [Microcystis aeruginosa NIES-298]
MSFSKTLLQFQLVYKVLSKDSTFLTYAVIYIFLKNKEIKNIDQHKYLSKINYTYLTPLLPLASCLSSLGN